MSALKRIREIELFHNIVKIRDWLMNKTGLFKLKKQIKYRFFLKRLVREDDKLKQEVAKKIMNLPDGYLNSETTDSIFILSLTSHGNRVEGSLPYALYSLVTQTVKPYRIVVYLNKEKWRDDNLPFLLKRLKQVGVSVYYCEDFRSYKKLIPALKQFPHNPIITFDDDFYYNPCYLEWMTTAFNSSDKHTVLGSWGCIPEKQNGKYLPYNQWKDCQYWIEGQPISFFGGNGTCYPPGIFDEEILNSDVFLKICPKADDIWFWAMEERLGIKRAYIDPKGYGYHRSVNRVYDYQVGADGCLTLSNVINGENNQQLRDVLDYYGLD